MKMKMKHIPEPLNDLFIKLVNTERKESTIFISEVEEVKDGGKFITLHKDGDSPGVFIYGAKLTLDFIDNSGNYIVPAVGSRVITQLIDGKYFVTFISKIDKYVIRSEKEIKITSDQVSIYNDIESLKGLLEDILENQNDLAGYVDDLNTQVAAITTQVAGAPVPINNLTTVTALSVNYVLIQTQANKIKTRLSDLLGDN